MGRKAIRFCLTGLLGLAAISLAGCTGNLGSVESMEVTAKERDCLTRAMYFESQRNSEEGLLAVGTVVMNRVKSEQYPNTICGVVGQHRQFAHGVLRKKMDPAQMVLADKVAGDVLSGKRSDAVGDEAMYFHAARIRIPYKNVHYVTVAGGNAFYEKRKGGGRQLPPLETSTTAVAEADKAKPAEAETPAAVAQAPQSPAPAAVTETAEAEPLKPSITPVAASMSPLPSGSVPSFAEPVDSSSSNTTFIQKSTFGW